MAIKFKGSNIPGIVPAPAEIEERELAINIADKKLFTKDSNDAIIEIGANNINTGLETPGQSSNIHDGHRYINITDATDYLPLGTNATDLTYSSGFNGIATIGANGVGSFAAGVDSIAQGVNSISIGNHSNTVKDDSIAICTDNVTNNNDSIAIGKGNQVSLDKSFAIGLNNILTKINTIGIGNGSLCNTDSTTCIGEGISSSDVIGSVAIGRFNKVKTGNIFTIGNGSNNSSRSNILELNENTGVLTLNNLTDINDITGNTDVITKGYLNQFTSTIVSKVNGFVGDVTLTSDHIANSSPNPTNIWFTPTEKNTLSAVQGQLDTKQASLPSIVGNKKKVLMLDATNGDYEWNYVRGFNTTLYISDIQEVKPYTSNDLNKFLKITNLNGGNLTGEIEFMSLNRTDVSLLDIDGSTKVDDSGTPDAGSTISFELSKDPYRWGINKLTKDALDNILGIENIPTTPPVNNSDRLRLTGVIIDNTAVGGNVTSWNQEWIKDDASTLLYTDTTPTLGSSNVQGAIDAVKLTANSGKATADAAEPSLGTAVVDQLLTTTGGTNRTWKGLGLSYTSSGTIGTITTDLNDSITIPQASTTIAGLIIPVDKTKLNRITVTTSVNLTTMASNISTNSGNITSQDGRLDNLEKLVSIGGNTSNRPSTPVLGTMYFDTTLSPKIPIWWEGAKWVKADGSDA